jgi:hypothetical protein
VDESMLGEPVLAVIVARVTAGIAGKAFDIPLPGKVLLAIRKSQYLKYET